MTIIIQNTSDLPIYQQIYNQIRESILSGDLIEGERLPSIRQLARDLKVSVITTTRAYSDLEKDDLLVNIQGKGCYVNAINQHILEEKLLVDIKRNVDEILKATKLLNKTNLETLELIKNIMEVKKNEV